MRTRLLTAACGLAVSFLPRVGSADGPCSGAVTRNNVVACALETSPALRAELASQRAFEGHKEAARPFLPSNPVLSGALASRSSPTGLGLNWNVGLAQELEIAGQSGLRVEAADGELRAQAQRLASAKAAVAADAWSAYFASIAAGERLTLAARLEAATDVVAATVRGMAAGGLASEVDADVAETAALKAGRDRLKAELQVSVARAQLRLALGTAVISAVTGPLAPLKIVSANTRAGPDRPELLALREAQRALDRRVKLLRRSRVPNPTVSLFAQSDGFDERVFGVGLSLPLPLPSPVGRVLSGEIAEGVALADQAGAAAAQVENALQAELAVALAEYEASASIDALYTPARAQRAATRLESLGLQVKAARLPVRDALIAQQALVELLQAEIDAREALCVASVRLARAAGLSLEGDAL